MSGAKVASKLELSTLVESLGSESGTEVFVSSSYGNVSSSVVSSVGNGDSNLEEY